MQEKRLYRPKAGELKSDSSADLSHFQLGLWLSLLNESETSWHHRGSKELCTLVAIAMLLFK